MYIINDNNQFYFSEDDIELKNHKRLIFWLFSIFSLRYILHPFLPCSVPWEAEHYRLH